MSVIVSTQEEVQEYFNSPRLGQSKLKLLLGELSSFDKEFDSSAEHFLIGSAVDCILTAGGEEVYNSLYYASKIEKKPTEAIVAIINIVYERILEDFAEYLNSKTVLLPTTNWSEKQIEEDIQEDSLTDFGGELANWEAYILDACEKTGWQPRWGADAKLKNVIEPGAEYFKDVLASFGKTIVSSTQDDLIKRIVLSLRTNSRTKRFFDIATVSQLQEVEFYYQFPIYFEYRQVECKALLDLVVVVREPEGRILNVTGIDLKTMSGNTMNFIHSVKQRRYDCQAAWYSLALTDHFALWNNISLLKPFMFVVESTTFVGKPITFEVSDSLLNIGRNGKKAITLVHTNLFDQFATDSIIRNEILGFEQLLDLYIYHTENGFDEEKVLKEAGNNPLILEWDGIVSKDSL